MRFTFDLHDINASLLKSGQYEVQVRVSNDTVASICWIDETSRYKVSVNDQGWWIVTQYSTSISDVKRIIRGMRRYYQSGRSN